MAARENEPLATDAAAPPPLGLGCITGAPGLPWRLHCNSLRTFAGGSAASHWWNGACHKLQTCWLDLGLLLQRVCRLMFCRLLSDLPGSGCQVCYDTLHSRRLAVAIAASSPSWKSSAACLCQTDRPLMHRPACQSADGCSDVVHADCRRRRSAWRQRRLLCASKRRRQSPSTRCLRRGQRPLVRCSRLLLQAGSS